MLPVAPRCERAPAQPAGRRVQARDARLDRGVRAGQPGAAGVVEVPAQRQFGDHRAQLCDQRPHPAGCRGADGVGDAEPVGAAVTRRRGDVENPLRRGGPVERAIPGDGDDDLDADIAVVRDGDDLADLFFCLRAAAPTLAWLNASLAATTYSIERRPAATARLAPPALATNAEKSMSG